jgi:hypothetical protein
MKTGVFWIKFLVIFVFIYISSDIKSQNCYNLKIIVRLYVNAPKEQFLREQALAKPDKSAAYQKMLNDHLGDRRRYINSIVTAFNKYFDQYELYYIPDSLWNEFVAQESKPAYFINSKGELDPSISTKIDENTIIVTRRDYDDDFLVVDKSGNRLPPPFPSSVKHNLFSKIRSLMGDAMDESVERYAKAVRKYCEGVTSK